MKAVQSDRLMAASSAVALVVMSELLSAVQSGFSWVAARVCSRAGEKAALLVDDLAGQMVCLWAASMAAPMAVQLGGDWAV